MNACSKLANLISDTLTDWECDVSEQTIAEIAEHLIDNGITVLPAKDEELCAINVVCCDDNCQRCAQRIYQSYINNQRELMTTREFIHHNELEFALAKYVEAKLGN